MPFDAVLFDWGDTLVWFPGLTRAWLAPGRARPPEGVVDHHLGALTELLDVVRRPAGRSR